MLQISLLTPFRLSLEGQSLKLFSRRTEALFVYLLRNPQPHARDVLANLFWDDLPQKKAMGNLRVLLANLRKQVGPYVVITRRTAAFDVDSPHRLDLTAVEEGLALARTEMTHGDMLSRSTAAQLADLLSAYQGDLLPGFYLRGGQGFEEWLATEREWLWTRVVEALEDLTTAALHWGDYRTGIVQAQRLVDFDPLREEGHQQLMQLWAADGQISAALAQHERCVQILDQELGVPPHPFTTELYERIRDGGWRLPRAVADAPARARPAIQHNLPRPMTSFWGRTAELAQLANLLADPTAPLITIVGAGGMGKTALAIEAARRLVNESHLVQEANGARSHVQDGVYLVSLASISDIANIAPAIAGVIGYTFQKDGGDETTQLLRHLRNRSMLLLLDNAEHLLEETDLFSEILAAAAHVHLLVTSRHKLNLHGETILPLEGLDYPQAELATDFGDERSIGEILIQYSAVRLFVESVRRTHGSVALSDAELQAVAQICRLAQGMPLAILLAAAWVEMLSPAEIAVEITQDVAFLSANASDEMDEPPARQRSMHAIFNHSWNLLTKEEQQIFARMSIFRGGCTRQVAQQVTGGSLRELISLAHKSLLLRSISSGRFTIHELLRQMAAEKLIEMGQTAAPLHRLAVETAEHLYDQNLTPYYGELAYHAGQAGLPDKARRYWRLAGDTARDLYQNKLALEQYGHALRLTPAADREAAFQLRMERQAIDHILGRREEQASELAALGKLAEELNDGRKQSEVYICRARYAEALGKYDDAARAAQAAVTLAEEAQASDLLARGNLAWGVALGRDSAFDAAQKRLEAAVRYAEEACLPLVAADSLRNLGIDAAYQDKYELAKGYFEQNLEIYRRMGNRPGEAAGLGNLGALALRQGDYHGAQPYLEQAVAIFRQMGDLRSEAIGLNNLGVIAHKLGEYAEAQQRFEHALRIARLIDDRQSRREAHNLLGHLFSDQMQYKKARDHYEEALQLAQALNSRGHVVESQVGLAAIALAEGDGDIASLLLLDVSDDINEPVLAQAEDAPRVYWRAYQILTANRAEQASGMLENASAQLQQQATQIPDETLRQSFLQDAPVHRAVIAEHQKKAGF